MEGVCCMRVAIIGSRKIEYSDKIIKLLLNNIPCGCSEIVSGGAVGIDRLAAKTADALGIHTVEILPDYETFGPTAPLIRNKDISRYADCVIALWDYKSRGTRSVILDCLESGKPVRIIGIY